MILNNLVPKEKLSIPWQFSLPTYGYVTGVIGVICRIIGIILTSVLMAEQSSDDTPMLYLTILKSVLVYLITTLVANIFFIAAVMKKWANILLPYLSIQGIELVGVVFMLIFGCYVFEALDLQIGFWLLLSTSFCNLVIQAYLYYQSIRLFRDMEVTAALQKALEYNIKPPLTT